MVLLSLLGLSVSLVTEGKINYLDLVVVEALTSLLGIGLWVVGLDLWRGQGRWRKLGGATVLLLAGAYSLAWVGFNAWGYQQLRDYLG